ncbi:MAG: hypothetical protein A3F70_16670 [Acidobacteria bacterium RIFCSPLOWO2_12_FULL_67_14]|nr:MAG: hypothetical protein A3H29_11185 [Acidobacteria bacterium RIFCSPLOWO2_02_FULL_67_21]OFW37340.1 MAG: hypothetical protein A3F70_16670 [Acidobacteria bacterium RIFCSPLOWO2_12_FULL_67_14]
MRVQEAEDRVECRQETACQFGVRRFPDDHEQRHPVRDDGCKFIRLVSDAAVVSERHPPANANRFKPHIIRAVVGKVIAVPLDG